MLALILMYKNILQMFELCLVHENLLANDMLVGQQIYKLCLESVLLRFICTCGLGYMWGCKGSNFDADSLKRIWYIRWSRAITFRGRAIATKWYL